MTNSNIKFLLGSNTKRGFYPLFDELRNPTEGKRLYILKGGPGSGKSSLMKRVIKLLNDKKHTMEYIHCASDPKSLDAFIDYDAGISMVDGTSPHIMDPKYPGAYDVIINMAECWDDKKLIQNKNEIIPLSNTILLCHNMATSCIRSAAALLDCNMTIASSYINHDTVDEFTQKIIKELSGSKNGKERKRLLSAVSVGETVFFGDTITNLSTKQYIIPDKWGAASGLILSKIHEAAKNLRLDHITCYCSLSTPDKIDHIIFPSAGIAISNANVFHNVKGKKQEVLEDIIKPLPTMENEQMNLHLDKAKDLIATASKHIERAKLLHDDLEAFYIEAMDFSKVDDIYEKIAREIS